MPLPYVASLFVYPIKSAAGVAVESLELDAHGACGDRRWMLVDDHGVMISQRTAPRLAHVRPSFLGDDRNGDLRIEAPGIPGFELIADTTSAPRAVRIWNDMVQVHDAGNDAAQWMEQATGRVCRVVRVAHATGRALQSRMSGGVSAEGREVALPDAAPLLVLGAASIRALNDRLAECGEDAVGVERFRPNVLLEGTAAHEEDGWRELSIGGVTVSVGDPCARCVMTTIDQDTLEQGTEPLRTLALYRRQGGGVMFGMNCTHAAAGVVRSGDEVRVLGHR